jgi:hypothetical protein
MSLPSSEGLLNEASRARRAKLREMVARWLRKNGLVASGQAVQEKVDRKVESVCLMVLNHWGKRDASAEMFHLQVDHSLWEAFCMSTSLIFDEGLLI